MSDSVLREAARLLRAGAPVDVFVGALDLESLTTLATECARAAALLRSGACSCGEPSWTVDHEVDHDSPVCCCKHCYDTRPVSRAKAMGRHGDVSEFLVCADCPHRVPS